MLLQVLMNHPEAIGTIVKSTPTWVWGILAALMALGLSQVRDRVVSVARIAAMPVAMTGFALWGIVSAFGGSPHLGMVVAAWLAAAALAVAVLASGRAHGQYNPQSHTFAVPGSWVPMLLIVAIFLTKYAVGVELAMQPTLARDTTFAVTVAALYGAFSGIFTGRAARLLLLTRRPTAAFA